jgi:hypothetical protein
VFGASIVSDWENPAATTSRALLGALVAAGHDVTFLERRGNRPTVDLLRARGSGGLRAFAARYPQLQYRTYELPTGNERTVWLGREVATSDAVLVLDDAPEGVVEEIAAFESPSLVRLPAVTADRVPHRADRFDRVLTPLTSSDVDDALAFGPAVTFVDHANADPRHGVAVVAYGNAAAANALADELAEWSPELLSPGSVVGDRWSYVPEVDLDARFRRLRRALVIAADPSPLAVARLLLPLAQRCAVVGVAVEDEPEPPPDLRVPVVRLGSALPDLNAVIERSAEQRAVTEAVPRRYDASVQAQAIARLVRTTLTARRS